MKLKNKHFKPLNFSYKIYILDNEGNIKFIVYLDKNIAYLVSNKTHKLIQEIHFINKFIGGKKSSILLETKKHNYIFISDSIYEFQTQTSIIKFKSILCNSKYIYAFAYDKDNIYYLSFKEYIQNQYISNYNKSKDLYNEYFKLFNNSNKYQQKKIFKKLKFKILVN
jgi:hypothetical protein